MTRHEDWDKRERQWTREEQDLSKNINPNDLTDIDNLPKRCDHGKSITEGQCLLCLFGDEYDNPEQLR